MDLVVIATIVFAVNVVIAGIIVIINVVKVGIRKTSIRSVEVMIIRCEYSRTIGENGSVRKIGS